MGDWKQELGKYPNYSGGGGAIKKCACGNVIKKEGAKQCYECFQKMREGSSGTGNFQHSADLPAGYLSGGYFEKKNGKNYIREEVFISWAKGSSAVLKQQGLTSAAIRRFFSKLRAIEYKHKMTHDFDLAREGLYAFVRDVSYTENRGVTPFIFSKFIEANIQEAKKDAEHFRAFIEHFQSVVAFFKDK